jgi:translation initiation factor 1
MAKKMTLEDLKDLVFSTDPDSIPKEELDEIPALDNSKQKLYISLDKKQRGGKKVTLVEGFQGHEDDLKDLGKELKKICGAGGAVKAEEIIIQGDFVNKVMQYLQKQGYQVKKKGG